MHRCLFGDDCDLPQDSSRGYISAFCTDRNCCVLFPARLLESHRRALGIGVSVSGLVLLLLAMFYMPLIDGLSLSQCIESGKHIDMATIGNAFVGTDRFQYLLPFEAISILLLACIIGGVTVARKR